MGLLFKNVTNKKVIIIDEEVDLCLLMRNYFIRKNCSVHVSHTLEDGLLRITGVAPEIVIIDPMYCKNRIVIIQKILDASSNVQLIVSGSYMIYNNCDFL